MKRLEVKKGEILQRKGDLNSKVFKVESGLLRSYTIDEKGKQHIYQFGPEDWIIADATPNKTKSKLYIDCLEDSVVYQLEKDFDLLLSESGKISKRLEVLQNRVIMLMSASALERYEHFVETYPSILQRVSNKMIASYLGITPEALSRIRKEISNRK